MDVIAYCRVSTLGQSNSSQLESINRYCAENNLKLTKQIEQQISSRKDISKRLSWIEDLKPGDMLIVAELSRLGRSIKELISTINFLEQKNVEVHIIDRKLTIRKNNNNLESTILLGLFSLLAEVERSLISERTKRGLQASSRRGGRPRGTKYDLKMMAETLNSSENIHTAANKLAIPDSSIRALISAKYLQKIDNFWIVS